MEDPEAVLQEFHLSCHQNLRGDAAKLLYAVLESADLMAYPDTRINEEFRERANTSATPSMLRRRWPCRSPKERWVMGALLLSGRETDLLRITQLLELGRPDESLKAYGKSV
ncbi:hypothetical protein MUK42_33133, partial [Musa troglodytarum]